MKMMQFSSFDRKIRRLNLDLLGKINLFCMFVMCAMVYAVYDIEDLINHSGK
jgi:hypothetical protein